jgi:hypothetical protein
MFNEKEKNQEQPSVLPTQKLSLEEQKKRLKQRKAIIIEEFGQSLINFLYDGIWTPLKILDLLEVNFQRNSNSKTTIENAIKQSIEIHKENLKEGLYRKSLNFQPAHILLVVKTKDGEFVDSFRNYEQDIIKLVKSLDVNLHRLIVVRYVVPPVPDDLYKPDEVEIPLKFQEVLKNIATYVNENFNEANLDFEKFERLINLLGESGTLLQFPKSQKEYSLKNIKTIDCDEVGYNKLTIKQTIKDTVEKADIIVIPVYVLLLAFFCSSISESTIFSYHYLFSATGASEKQSIASKSLSFPKLFNQLLDESLLPQQFNQCLLRLYHEVFRPREEEINNLLESFREEYERLLAEIKDSEAMQKLLKTAKANGNVLSVGQAIMTTDLPPNEVQKLLNESLQKGLAHLENEPKSGGVLYHFDV